jgi:hypothetical protein
VGGDAECNRFVDASNVGGTVVQYCTVDVAVVPWWPCYIGRQSSGERAASVDLLPCISKYDQWPSPELQCPYATCSTVELNENALRGGESQDIIQIRPR